MDELLTPVRQIYKSTEADRFNLEEVKKVESEKLSTRVAVALTSFDDALEALKNQPDYDTLDSVLELLVKGTRLGQHGTRSVHSPTPHNAQIIQALVTDIVPNYWRLLKDEDATEGGTGGLRRKASAATAFQRLLICLRSVTGVNAILTHLRGLMGELKADVTTEAKRSHMALNLEILLELLCSLLAGADTMHQIWQHTTSGLENVSMKRPLAQELTNVVSGGRVVSLAAEAEDLVRKKSEQTSQEYWVSNSSQYVAWLARNITSWARQDKSGNDGKMLSGILVRALRLGHSDKIIERLVTTLLLETNQEDEAFERLFQSLPQVEQKRVVEGIIKFASDTYLSHTGQSLEEADKGMVSAVAGLISRVVHQVESRRNVLVSWLTSASGAAPGEPIGIRRAVMAALSLSREDIATVLEKSLVQFGDQLYIRHSPIMQQEAHAQVLLLSAGYLYRQSPVKLAMQVRSSPYLNLVSNRLGAPQTRARILGMIVGEALSAITQSGAGKALDFDMEELRTDEAVRYKNLVNVSDGIGPVDILRKQGVQEDIRKSEELQPGIAPQPRSKPGKPAAATKPPAQPPKTGFIIEEVDDDDDEEEDEDLVPYAKPDSDAEDSDDDPELIRRDKPRAPVYIRDLIAYLRDTENYDRQRLALTAAPTLIRRKADYGTEVKEHAEELAALLVGLQDKFDMDDFAELKMQGMVALVVAQPARMGPWFGRTFFEGDYSLSQRAGVLTTLGVGAREIAGLDVSAYREAASFPSKRLPDRVETLYLDSSPIGKGAPSSSSSSALASSSRRLKALPPNAIDGIAHSITRGFLAPMATDAADKAAGPDVLKLESLKARQRSREGEGQQQQKKKKAEVRAIPNTTARLVSTAFFFPLTARFQAAARSPRARPVVFQPELLAHLVRTLAVLVHAAGPSTLALPDMTAELWRLLLGGGVRAHCLGGGGGGRGLGVSEAGRSDMSVTRAVLFALLALLDVNGSESRMREVCRELSSEVVETQGWVSLVFESTRGGDQGVGGEEEEVRMLAAGVLVRLSEAMERFRAYLIGDLIG